MKFDQYTSSQLASLAKCGMCFSMSVSGRAISELLEIAKAAREADVNVEMVGLVDWQIDDIREIGLAAKGHVMAR